ncbi:HTH-type transcriptional regulator SgrR [Paludibacterium purpuratum]|uniref:SgrR family transcriptional regulator n=1 Tax=Paludibacterium purpuratum TaxID=1144873 RepID=A0A4R7B6W9_9NEIS|nr:HTH-type transcriptional regulator SgrR [Paludibacterium purpuratum]TDR80213.1 SgrR family transcriptional regulator [Paludibacterium purpuratum]
MPQPRLTQQYTRLRQAMPEPSVQTSLQTLADTLHCTRRHMRNLLQQMQTHGWIDWQATPGRGGRSRLTFLRSVDSLQRERAEHLLTQGRIDQAVDLIDDRDALSALLLSRLGQRWEQGRQVLTVPYYRQLPDLQPGQPLRRTERHLASQIFNGLLRHNEEKGEIEADLAHHWRQVSPTEWHFHLRPAVRWHDGTLLTVEQVVASLQRLRRWPLYRHWRGVRALSPRSLAIDLAEPDAWLPWLVADANAMIVRESLSSLPIGTGPYRVLANDRYQLRLQAFDDYFGYRAQLDEVDILIVPDLAGDALHERRSSCELQVLVQSGTDNLAPDEMVSEQGCHFLLFDARSSRMRSPALRQWLSRELAPQNLIADLSPAVRRYWTPATSLLPQWFHTPPPAAVGTQEHGLTLRLAYHADQPDYPLVVDAMARRLAERGVLLECHCISYADWDQGLGDFDLWQGSINFSGNPDYAVSAWLLGTPLVRHCLDSSSALPVTQWHAAWRSGEMTAQQLAAEVVRQGWLLPLFHHWFRLQGSQRMQGVRLNSLGWFDFKSAWLES